MLKIHLKFSLQNYKLAPRLKKNHDKNRQKIPTIFFSTLQTSPSIILAIKKSNSFHNLFIPLHQTYLSRRRRIDSKTSLPTSPLLFAPQTTLDKGEKKSSPVKQRNLFSFRNSWQLRRCYFCYFFFNTIPKPEIKLVAVKINSQRCLKKFVAPFETRRKKLLTIKSRAKV